jgi:hypothetical protein
MNNNQSEALRWANILTLNVGSQLINRKQAAAELRRLHEENQQWQEKCNTYIQIHDAVVKDNERLHEMNAELVEALEKALYGLKYHTSQTGSLRLTNGVMQVVNDALAKAEGKE